MWEIQSILMTWSLISWSGRDSSIQAVMDDRSCLTSDMNSIKWNKAFIFLLQKDGNTGQRIKNESEGDKLWNINMRNRFWRGLCEFPSTNQNEGDSREYKFYMHDQSLKPRFYFLLNCSPLHCSDPPQHSKRKKKIMKRQGKNSLSA